jgi:hypothetical protein
MTTIDSVIATYMRLREQKRKKEEEVKAIKTNLGKLEAWLALRADEQDVTSFKTTHGTATLTTSYYASVADWPAITEYVKQHDAFDLLEKRVCKAVVKAHLDEYNSIPPGISYGTKKNIVVRKPTVQID